MISKWQWLLQNFGSRMWVRASLFALAGVLAALLAVQLDPFVPKDLPAKIGSDAVHQILDILASSMLAVTTFSLSVMVAAYATATNNVTPRATRLLIEDPTTQNVLSVFLGTFLFSLVGIVALNTGYYTDRGRFILFAVSIFVIGVVVFAMLRWIHHLTLLGRVGETTERVEHATADAIATRLKNPFLGGRPLASDQYEAMKTGEMIRPRSTGYVAYIDMESVQKAAEGLGVSVCLCALPGHFVYPARPLAIVLQVPAAANEGDGTAEQVHDTDREALIGTIRSAYSIRDERSFAQDPRFGIEVLTEIASRALSPGINDPGTAIDVLTRGVRLLEPWVSHDKERHSDDIVCKQVYVPEITVDDLFGDLFTPIARDGARLVEVQIRLHKSLLALAELGGAESKAAALKYARNALERAEAALDVEDDKKRLRELFNDIETCAREARPAGEAGHLFDWGEKTT